MKKTFMLIGAVLLLAAGCGSKQAAESTLVSQGQQATPANQNRQNPAQAEPAVKVNNVDEAVDALEKISSSEQVLVSAQDDSDLTVSDLSELNGYTEVPDGN